MGDEGIQKVFVFPDVAKRSLGLAIELIQIQRREIRQPIHFQVRPEIFDRIQIRRVRRKEFGLDSAVLFEPPIDGPGAVRDQPVPNDDDMAADVLEKLIQKLYENLRIRIFPLEKSKHQAGAPSGKANGYRADRGNLFVRSRSVADSRRLPRKSPGPLYNGGHQDSTLVYEDDGRFETAGFFLIRVHS